MKIPCSGVIVSGGLNRRFGGKTKALIPVGGRKIIDRTFDLFQELFEEVILVTNDPPAYLAWDIQIVTDLFPIRSALTGIHTALFYSRSPYAFISACDTPFIKKEMVELLLDNLERRFDVIIPETPSGLEPLCAIYSKRCLKPVERNLVRQQLKIDRFFQMVRLKKISEPELRAKDPELISFFNINTPVDLEQAEQLARAGGVC